MMSLLKFNYSDFICVLGLFEGGISTVAICSGYYESTSQEHCSL